MGGLLGPMLLGLVPSQMAQYVSVRISYLPTHLIHGYLQFAPSFIPSSPVYLILFVLVNFWSILVSSFFPRG